MTDLTEDTWMDRGYVTHADLVAESERVIGVLTREHTREMDKVRDQLLYLNKTHTVALMAAELFTTDIAVDGNAMNYDNAARAAKLLYREVQKSLEIDREITGSIPAA